MANARRKGVRLGRPAASERPHVARQFADVRTQLAAGTLSKRAAARRLKVGQATLARLLAAAGPPAGAPKREAGPEALPPG
jgi:DNA invertase Pin-like site-specific DNA recombinase